MPEGSETDPFAEWAAVYDVVYADHEEDVAFYCDEARRADGRVLEVGCGTGRIYLDLLDAGVDAVGVDTSGAMLQRIRAKAEGRGLSPTVLQADMRRLPVSGEFEFVCLPFNAFLHNLTAADQVATLRGVRDLLVDGGRMALDVPVLHPTVQVEPTEDRHELTRDGVEYELVQRYDVPSVPDQVMDVSRTLSREGERVGETSYQYAVLYRREMEHLLARAGFSTWSVYGGFDAEAFEPDSSRMVWVARE
jgi:SAM-dependent methyltransferase